MEEQRNLRKQFFIHIVYNMIAFALIFIAFGICMFGMIRTITFSATDNQLRETKNEFADVQVTLENLYKIFDLENFPYLKNGNLGFFEYNIAKRVNNPQINLILRDKNGKILNENDLGKLENYANQIEFDSENLDVIYTLNLEDEYNYRCLNFKINGVEENSTYVQLLMNVDSENLLISKYLEIITYAVILGIEIGRASCRERV